MDSIELLRKAGWFPGRTVDISLDLAALATAGFEVTEAAETFLRENSGLRIAWESKLNPLKIDGAAVARSTDPEWCQAYSAAIGSPLVPVGEYSLMVLYIDSSGDLWGAADNEYGRGGGFSPTSSEASSWNRAGISIDGWRTEA